jgi:hypothetical protein
MARDKLKCLCGTNLQDEIARDLGFTRHAIEPGEENLRLSWQIRSPYFTDFY